MEAAGCLIIDTDFETTRVDGLSQWSGAHPVVMLNVGAPTDRRRLTLAHELGHLCLHRQGVPDDVESDANTFAAEFLMPAETIRPELRNLTVGRLHDLKRYWRVSMQALIERAHRHHWLPRANQFLQAVQCAGLANPRTAERRTGTGAHASCRRDRPGTTLARSHSERSR